MNRKAGLLALVFSIAALVHVSLAAEPQEQSVKLAIRDAVKVALERNLEIAVARLDPKRAEYGVEVERSVFDPSVAASYAREKTTEEPSSTFSRLGSETDDVQMSYADPTQIGGQFDATLTYRDSANEYTADALSEFRFVPVSQSSTLTLQYSQSLLRNFGLEVNTASIELAKNSLQISEAELRTRTMDVVERTVQAYWNMVGAEQSLDVARQSLSLAEDFLAQTKIRVEVGTLPPIDVTQAEAEVASREEGVIVAEADLERARDLLRQLMRVPDDSPEWMLPIEPLDEPGFSPRSVSLDEALQTALAKRPDIEQAEIDLRSAMLSERAQRNQTRPDLRVVGSYSATGNSFDYVPETVTGTIFDPGPDGIPGTPDDIGFVPVEQVEFQPVDQGKSESLSEIPDLENTFWTVRLEFAYPLMNRRARAEYARARIGVDQSELRLEQAKLLARVEVRDAVRDLETNARRVASARANLVLQRKKLEAEQKRYENGLSTAFQVLQFQKDQREAEQREISAIVAYNNAEVTYARVVGTLLETLGVRLGEDAVR